MFKGDDMPRVIKKANRILLSNLKGKPFMEFSFNYEKNGSVIAYFHTGDFQEIFLDNYSGGLVNVRILDGSNIVKDFDTLHGLIEEGSEDIRYLLTLSEILSDIIIQELPY
jgi:hypothetical protein